LLATLLCLAGPARAAGVPVHDRVVILVMENKSFGVASAGPYVQSLMAQGATLNRSFGVARPSQPNYFGLFAGSDLGITTNGCPAPGSPFSAENLGHALEASARTWRAYSENLPSPGATGCSYDGDAVSGLYTRKHAPWTSFNNLDHQNERPYTDLAVELGSLPTVSFIVPNNCHNTHNNSTPGCTVPDGDVWLSQNVPPILAALGPNGLFILTYDEDDGVSGNRILTVFVGPHVKPGFVSNIPASHYTVVRTLCESLGLPLMGKTPFETAITDVWQEPVPAMPSSWGRVKATYR
jgi:acid phosphatase